MYRPRSRSRSPPPRGYRRYSPSRAISRSPSPPRRRFDDGPRRSPPRRYEDDFRRPASPPRRYRDDYSPPRGRYGDDDPRARYSPPPPRQRSRSPPRGGRRGSPEYSVEDMTYSREDDRGRFAARYDDRPAPRAERYEDQTIMARGMVADREEYRDRDAPASRGHRMSEDRWERGQDIPVAQPISNSNIATNTASQAIGHSSDVSLSTASSAKPRVTAGGNPSPPAREIICIGLDEELSEEDLMGYFRGEHQAQVESCKIVRKRFADSGRTNCLGFVTFTTIEGASEFIENNLPETGLDSLIKALGSMLNNSFPAILMPALYEHSEPKKVRIDFVTPQGSLPGHVESTYGYGAQFPPSPRAAHDGMRDVGPPAPGKRVLLLRGLDPKTYGDEVIRRMGQEIAKMLGKYGLEKQAEQAICRVAMIVDRVGSQSWGLCFVEVATAELATALVPFLTFPQYQPQGFLISGSPIAVSFAASESFVPTPTGPLGGQFLIRAIRSGGIGSDTIDAPDGEWVGYWHHQGGAIQKVPAGGPKFPEDGHQPDLTDDLKELLGYLAGTWQVAPAVDAAQAAPSTEGLLSNVAMQPIKIGAIGFGVAPPQKPKKIVEDAIIPLSTKNVLGDDDEEEDMVGKDSVLLSRTKGAGIVIPMGGKKMAKNISKWNTKQAELAKPRHVPDTAVPAGLSDANRVSGPSRVAAIKNASADNVPAVASSSKISTPEVAVPEDDGFDYTDTSTFEATGKVACLLCQRQFKSAEVLRKHVAQSDLHKTNLLDASTREGGRHRKAAAVSAATANEAAKYRDRAAERRTVFNQPDKPSMDELQTVGSSAPQKRKFVDAPAPPPPSIPATPGVEPGKDETNRGNQLLAKMGWSAGTGLGKEREGRVDPVMVQQFESRAGLGASKGVEAGRWDGPEGHKRRALDMAEQRYNRQ